MKRKKHPAYSKYLKDRWARLAPPAVSTLSTVSGQVLPCGCPVEAQGRNITTGSGPYIYMTSCIASGTTYTYRFKARAEAQQAQMEGIERDRQRQQAVAESLEPHMS